jgi:hypothetical protein
MVNGERVEVPPIASLRAGAAGGRDLGLDLGLAPSSYVALTRPWRDGDVVQIRLPKSLHLEPTPDDGSVAAIMWGPLVLAGDLGPRRERRGDTGGDGRRNEGGRPVPPALVAAGRPLDEWIVPSGKPGNFRAIGVARPLATDPTDTTARVAGGAGGAGNDVALAPFYRTHGRTYSVYFDVLTPADYDVRLARAATDRERLRRLEQATVAFVQPGDTVTEQTFAYRSEPADRPVIRTRGRTARGGPGWFSFDVLVEPNTDMALVITHLNDLGLPVLGNFDVLVDGTRLAHYSPNRDASAYWDAWYDIPAALLSGKRTITVRFQAAPDARVVPVYGVRVVRTKDAR